METAQQEFEGLLSDPEVRRQLRKTLKGFALLYFPHHLYLPPGEHHEAMIAALEDPLIEFLQITGFRGCSKTTFGSLIVPIFFALEKSEEYPFIIIAADTRDQSGLNIANIKHELETNQLLLQDYGKFDIGATDEPVPEPTLESDEEWQARNMLLSNGVRILARSRGQKIRGLKHRQYRPRCIIVDDPEDIKWVKTKENRDTTENWLNSEVIPALDRQKRKLIILINLLHMDALAARVKAKGTFTVLEYALVNDADEWESCLWKAQYPDQKAIDDERARVGTVAWQREYKLKVVAEEDQIIKPEDIHYYDALPQNAVASIKGHGIDLAISQKEDADYTTDVEGDVFYVDAKDVSKSGDTPRVFILPDPFNEHVTFHDFMKRERNIPGERKGAHLFFVEDVGYQKAAIQEMERAMLPVVPMRPTTDKRSRLQVVAPYIKNGTVLFPRTGCEQLLGQIFNLGVESHDDLCLVARTKIATPFGDRPIEVIRVGDSVITPLGLKKVLAAAQTGIAETISVRGLEGTPNHPVFVHGCGFMPLDALPMLATLNTYNPTSAFQWQYQKLLHSMESSTVSWEGKDGITLLSTRTISSGSLRKDFMSRFGSFITKRQFRPALRFITRTAILITTTLLIWSAYRASNIVISNPAGSFLAKKLRFIISKLSGRSPKNGTDRQRDANGIGSKLRELGRTLASSIAFASFAVGPSNPSTEQECSVDTFVRTEIGRDAIPEPSPQETKPRGRKSKRPVYNLAVEGAHCYYANGLLVGNCDGLTTLLNGLVEQGLELPKIHWIET